MSEDAALTFGEEQALMTGAATTGGIAVWGGVVHLLGAPAYLTAAAPAGICLVMLLYLYLGWRRPGLYRRLSGGGAE
jgi:uncharacterized membrane protein